MSSHFQKAKDTQALQSLLEQSAGQPVLSSNIVRLAQSVPGRIVRWRRLEGEVALVEVQSARDPVSGNRGQYRHRA